MTRGDRLILWSITLAAALLRFAYGLVPRVVRWDEAGHLLVASNLVSGRAYSELAGSLDVHLPPFLPIVSAAYLSWAWHPPGPPRQSTSSPARFSASRFFSSAAPCMATVSASWFGLVDSIPPGRRSCGLQGVALSECVGAPHARSARD